MLLLMWLAVLPPEHNPIIDDHVIYIIALVGVAATNRFQQLGLGRWWQRTRLVRRRPILQ